MLIKHDSKRKKALKFLSAQEVLIDKGEDRGAANYYTISKCTTVPNLATEAK